MQPWIIVGEGTANCRRLFFDRETGGRASVLPSSCLHVGFPFVVRFLIVFMNTKIPYTFHVLSKIETDITPVILTAAREFEVGCSLR